MQNLIDKSLFVADINIPNTEDVRVEQKINSFISRNQGRFLTKLLGKDIYLLMGSEISTRMTILKGDDNLKLMLAYYVYYQIIESDAEQTTGINTSVGKSDNAIVVSPEDKLLSAWNKMSDICYDFLFTFYNSGIYPEFGLLEYSNAVTFFRRNNQFGI